MAVGTIQNVGQLNFKCYVCAMCIQVVSINDLSSNPLTNERTVSPKLHFVECDFKILNIKYFISQFCELASISKIAKFQCKL